MRKNTAEVFKAWIEGRTLNRHRSISTNGDHIYSYGTILVDRRPDGTPILNETRYSVTTSRQQGDLRYLMSLHGIEPVKVDGAPIGCSDLRRFAT